MSDLDHFYELLNVVKSDKSVTIVKGRVQAFIDYCDSNGVVVEVTDYGEFSLFELVVEVTDYGELVEIIS